MSKSSATLLFVKETFPGSLNSTFEYKRVFNRDMPGTGLKKWKAQNYGNRKSSEINTYTVFSGIMKYHFSIFVPFLLEAVEASLGYFFENWF